MNFKNKFECTFTEIIIDWLKEMRQTCKVLKIIIEKEKRIDPKTTRKMTVTIFPKKKKKIGHHFCRISKVYNIDEFAVSFVKPRRKKQITKVGSRMVKLFTGLLTRSSDKRFGTAWALLRADAWVNSDVNTSRLPCALCIPGKISKQDRSSMKRDHPSVEAYDEATGKTTWCNLTRFLDYGKKTKREWGRLNVKTQKRQRSLMLLDGFPVHAKEELRNLFEKTGSKLGLGPANCTEFWQPWDQRCTWIVESYIRNEFEKLVHQQEEAILRGLEPTKYGLKDLRLLMVKWYAAAMRHLYSKTNIIRESFLYSGIFLKIDGSEDETFLKWIRSGSADINELKRMLPEMTTFMGLEVPSPYTTKKDIYKKVFSDYETDENTNNMEKEPAYVNSFYNDETLCVVEDEDFDEDFEEDVDEDIDEDVDEDVNEDMEEPFTNNDLTEDEKDVRSELGVNDSSNRENEEEMLEIN